MIIWELKKQRFSSEISLSLQNWNMKHVQVNMKQILQLIVSVHVHVIQIVRTMVKLIFPVLVEEPLLFAKILNQPITLLKIPILDPQPMDPQQGKPQHPQPINNL